MEGEEEGKEEDGERRRQKARLKIKLDFIYVKSLQDKLLYKTSVSGIRFFRGS